MGLFKKLKDATGMTQYLACKNDEPVDGTLYDVPAYEIYKVNRGLCGCGRPIHIDKKAKKRYQKCLHCLWDL